MRTWLGGDLQGLVLPADMERLRDLSARAAAEGHDLSALYGALARAAPAALLDLALGPKAPSAPRAVRAALGLAESLEAMTTAPGLYRRLVALQPALAEEIVEIAAARHPAAGWLVRFAERAQASPGLAQLRAASAHPAYEALCFAHAEAGHLDALAAEARAGRPEAAAALWASGAVERAFAAVDEGLRARPGEAALAWLAAVAGPSLDETLAGLLGRPGLAPAWGALLEQAEALPLARAAWRAERPNFG